MIASSPIVASWRRTIRVATAFWGLSLVLVAAEASYGANALLGGLYFFSIPALVGCLTWVQRDAFFTRYPASVLMLGLSVLASSSLIVFVGLLAASNLKTIIAGA